ncbi:MAG: hypothetical protein SGJ00_12155 [bacterium]|nr:hypothetical protein [bacterium]
MGKFLFKGFFSDFLIPAQITQFSKNSKTKSNRSVITSPIPATIDPRSAKKSKKESAHPIINPVTAFPITCSLLSLISFNDFTPK